MRCVSPAESANQNERMTAMIMDTRIAVPTDTEIKLAADLLKQGELVAFPTETVYGLGGNGLLGDAVEKIFQAKGRPMDNPLILHVGDWLLTEMVCTPSPLAQNLMEEFWPGPLTVLCPKTNQVPWQVTAGLPKVALRMPNHPVALRLLRRAGVPVAAPSANASGRPSPTLAVHVWTDLAGKIPLILDGGPCQIGVESTVVDVEQEQVTILRPGLVTREMLELVTGRPVDVAQSTLRPLQPGETALSPGMKHRHYAPAAKVFLVPDEDPIPRLRRCYREATAAGQRAAVMCFTEDLPALADCNPYDLGGRHHAETMAQRLFAILRQVDEAGMDVVFSAVVPPEGAGLAVMNRLGRAAEFKQVE